jgi:hypothetical protein
MAFLQHVMEVIQGVPAHFVFNMNEIGHQDWADRTKKNMYRIFITWW